MYIRLGAPNVHYHYHFYVLLLLLLLLLFIQKSFISGSVGMIRDFVQSVLLCFNLLFVRVCTTTIFLFFSSKQWVS